MALDHTLLWVSAAVAFFVAFLFGILGFYVAEMLDPYTKTDFQLEVQDEVKENRRYDEEEATGMTLEDTPPTRQPKPVKSAPMPIIARQAWVVDYMSAAPDDVEYEWRDGKLLVAFVLNDGFTSKRGIQVGDRVLEVNGVSVDELGSRRAQEILRKGAGSDGKGALAVQYELRLGTQDGMKLRESLSKTKIERSGLEVSAAGANQASWMVTYSDSAAVDCEFERKNTRLFVSFVPAGGRSHSRGIRVGDELAEANGVSVGELDKDGLDKMLRQRPLKLCFNMQLDSAAVSVGRVG